MLKFAGILPRNKVDSSNQLDAFFTKLNLCNLDTLIVLTTKNINSNNFVFFTGENSRYITDKDNFTKILDKIQEYDVEHLGCELREEDVPDFWIYSELIENHKNKTVLFINIPQPYQPNSLDEFTTIFSDIISEENHNFGIICSGYLSPVIDFSTGSIFEQTEISNIYNYFFNNLRDKNLEGLFSLTKDVIQNKYNFQEAFFGPFWVLLSLILDFDLNPDIHKEQQKFLQIIGTLYCLASLDVTNNNLNDLFKTFILSNYLKLQNDIQLNIPKNTKYIFVEISNNNESIFLKKKDLAELQNLLDELISFLRNYSDGKIFDLNFNVKFLNKNIKETKINNVKEIFNFDYLRVLSDTEDIFICLKKADFSIFQKYSDINFENASITGFTIS